MDRDVKTKGWREARAGDTVWYKTPQGQQGRGRVVMRFTTHVVLNIGGRHGTPMVVNDKNFVRMRKKAVRRLNTHD